MNPNLVGWIVAIAVGVAYVTPLLGPRLVGEPEPRPLLGAAPEEPETLPTMTPEGLAAVPPAAPASEPAPPPESPRDQRSEDQKRLRAAAKIDADRIAAADAAQKGNWLAHGRTYDEQRFSPLDQINRQTVADLGVAWEFQTGTTRGLEASPIVADGVMFLTGNWGQVWALDAKTGRELWTFDPEVPGHWARYACCDIVNRGVAVWKGRVYVGTLDGRLVALEAATGKPVWDINTIDRSRPYTITGAPRVVNDMVIIGNGGGELGVRGYITAYDARTGRQLWRFYTVPGDPSQPQAGPHLEAALATWPTGPSAPRWWEMGGGGTVWDSMAYDPELDLLYVGVGNGSPWSRWMRANGQGDNLYVSSILAIDPDDGALKWHFQTTPGDTWDYTATQHIILADLTIEGRTRKVLMQAPKNGFFYVIDRETGAFISGEAYVAMNWATGIDRQTGRPIENPDVVYSAATLENPKIIFPAQYGGHNWQPMSFSRETGLVYIPVIDLSAIYVAEKDPPFLPGFWNTGTDTVAAARIIQGILDGGQALPPARGYIRAWDPVGQKERWSVPMAGPWNGGLLSTAGGLVFGGGADGLFAAYDSLSGTQLWSIDLKTGILAPPVTYELDGEQYVVLMAGWGGAGGLANLRDPNTAVVKHGTNAGRVFAFKLGGPKEVALLPGPERGALREPPPVAATAEILDRGFEKYHRHCLVCHGYFGESVGVLPDLRLSAPEIWASYPEIVLGGALAANGMASFKEVLDAEDVEAIRAYLLSRARILYDQRSQSPPG